MFENSSSISRNILIRPRHYTIELSVMSNGKLKDWENACHFLYVDSEERVPLT